MDNVGIIINQIEEYLESSHWGDLTLEEIELIEDINKKKEYRQKWRNCFRYVINPLYSSIKNKSAFSFSNPDNLLTCRSMLNDLMNYYYNKGYSREEIINIASKHDIQKKH